MGIACLAIPSILSQLLNNAFRIIDQYCIQWLGAPAQAALGSTSFILIAAFSMFMFIGAGVGPLVGRATGANNPESRKFFIGQSLAWNYLCCDHLLSHLDTIRTFDARCCRTEWYQCRNDGILLNLAWIHRFSWLLALLSMQFIFPWAIQSFRCYYNFSPQ